MSLYNFLDSIDLTLEKNLKSYDNSFIDNFIDELKFSLYQHNVSKKSNLDYKELPKDTIFYVDYIEEGYASCFDTTQKNSEKYAYRYVCIFYCYNGYLRGFDDGGQR